jgi:hypothetical protein
MILGILLGISISISIASLMIIITAATGLIRENLATGAAIGTAATISYSSITLVISLSITYLFILILKNKTNKKISTKKL